MTLIRITLLKFCVLCSIIQILKQKVNLLIAKKILFNENDYNISALIIPNHSIIIFTQGKIQSISKSKLFSSIFA